MGFRTDPESECAPIHVRTDEVGAERQQPAATRVNRFFNSDANQLPLHSHGAGAGGIEQHGTDRDGAVGDADELGGLLLARRVWR